jgi:hypothetical protein
MQFNGTERAALPASTHLFYLARHLSGHPGRLVKFSRLCAVATFGHMAFVQELVYNHDMFHNVKLQL